MGLRKGASEEAAACAARSYAPPACLCRLPARLPTAQPATADVYNPAALLYSKESCLFGWRAHTLPPTRIAHPIHPLTHLGRSLPSCAAASAPPAARA